MTHTNETDDVAYRPSILTFFDILGFGALVEGSKTAADVARTLAAVQEYSAIDNDIAADFGQHVVRFSDTVVRTIDLDSEMQRRGRVGALFHELLDLVHLQAGLATKGIFVRGALTVGDIHVDESAIFGPALNRAHRLESKIAIYPRIIIDPMVLQLNDMTDIMIADHHDHQEERDYLQRVISQDSDGIWFVDYLTSMGDEVDEPGDYAAFLQQHRDRIVAAAKGLIHLDGIAAKYLWLATYHNRVVEQLEQDFLAVTAFETDDLRVPVEAIGPMYGLPNV